MADTLRWGILGTGGIAATMVGDLQLAAPRGEHVVTAVGSRTQESADRFGAEHGIDRRHGSYEALVGDDDVDIVYVASPHPWHHEHAVLATAAGKHVLVEKPFTMTAAQARDVVAAATRAGVFCMEAMWTRFLPHMVAIREVLTSGRLGDVVAVSADHGQWFPADPGFRLFDPALGGGALLDLGVYPVSFASMVAGGAQPERLAAVATPAFNGEVDGQMSMMFGYPGGAQAQLTCTSSAVTATRASIACTDGRIDVDPVWYQPTSFTVVPRTGEATRQRPETEGRGMIYQADECRRRILAGASDSDVLPLTETVAVMDTLDRVLAETGMATG